MARRDENECAHCAETMDVERRYVGKDWRVYCSPACQLTGEICSAQEDARRHIPITQRHGDYARTVAAQNAYALV